MRTIVVFLFAFFPQFLISQTTTITDERDGNVYSVIQIGDNLWMQENLRYKHQSGAFNKRRRKLKKFGNFYDNSKLDSLCPDGWHVPTLAEWDDTMLALMKLKGVIDSQRDTSEVKEDFNQELVVTRVIADKSRQLNLFSPPLNLKGFGWVDKGIRRKFLKSANLWVIDDIQNLKNYHLHVTNNESSSHHHKHHIEVKKSKKRHFNVRCIKSTTP